jgi:sporulation protein YlmC with PRC-barrel domain
MTMATGDGAPAVLASPQQRQRYFACTLWRMGLRTIIALKSTALLLGCAAEVDPRRAEASSAQQSRIEATRRAQALEPPRASTQRDLSYVISARRIIGIGIRDAQNAPLGTVRDVIFSTHGHEAALIVSRPGLRSFTGARYRVPWEAVEFEGSRRAVRAGIDAADLAQLRWRAGTAPPEQRNLRARDILRSKVYLEQGGRYGRVRDVIFDLSGELRGLVIVPAPMFGDRRGEREPHLYSGSFSFDVASRRVVLPHDRASVPRAAPPASESPHAARTSSVTYGLAVRNATDGSVTAKH